MPTNQQHYSDLIARASFNAEYFRGTIQDLSAAKRPMSFVGAPSWGRVNGLPCLKQNSNNDGVISAAVPAIIDCVSTFSLEMCLRVDIPLPANQLFFQVNAGGFNVYHDANQRMQLLLYTAAMAVARQINTPLVSARDRTLLHLAVRSTLGGAAGQWWINSVPVVTGLVGAGVAATPAASGVGCGGNFVGRATSVFYRAYPFALTNEDAACLYQQCRELTGGEV